MISFRCLASLLFFLFATNSSYLQGDLVDHLKSIPQDKVSFSLPGIDFIYLINLDERPDLYAKTLKELDPFSIKPYRFSAICERLLQPWDFRDISLKYQRGMGNFRATSVQAEDPVFVPVTNMQTINEPYVYVHMTRDKAANYLSHISVINDAFRSGYETVWILEDTIQVAQNPRVLTSLINELDILAPDWDVLFTDSGIPFMPTTNMLSDFDHRRPDMPFPAADSYAYRRRPLSTKFSWDGPRFGAYSYILRKSGMQKILQYFQENGLFLPFDAEFIYIPVNAFRVNRPIVTYFYPPLKLCLPPLRPQA